ncbi:uncharacterized protein LOC100899879 [Galendromus occidentalis]|uniref:Uncharacterized protein LOC100899879 n=1 Tax=Galendromus occidentalis TaxID=34638 RepID=A0AAJ6QR66_9ACAR|nr:uncharacterized protein LOC100899879 [Galendromus occidentalis]
MQEQQLEQAPGGVSAPAAGGGGGLDEIELSMADKIRRLVSSDEEWEAVLLQKMEEKRNREQGIETPQPTATPMQQAAAIGGALGNRVTGLFGKAKGMVPPVNIPVSMPNIPIPGLKKGAAAGAEGAVEGGGEYTQMGSE